MNQGFTLIELLVVVLIIGILAAIALPQYQTAVERSRATEALTQMNAIRTAMERYHSQHEAWPTTFNQLDVDIPANANCDSGFGGKYYCFTFSDGVVTAARLNGRHPYTLTTTILENSSNGTYTSTRTCAGTDDESNDYCNAIAGGAEKAASGF